MVKLDPQMIVFPECRERVLEIINFPSSLDRKVGFMPPLFYCLGAYLVVLLQLLLLSKPAWFHG